MMWPDSPTPDPTLTGTSTATPPPPGASSDRSLLRAWEILGGRPDNVRVRLDGASPAADLQSFLASHSEGTLELV